MRLAGGRFFRGPFREVRVRGFERMEALQERDALKPLQQILGERTGKGGQATMSWAGMSPREAAGCVRIQDQTASTGAPEMGSEAQTV